MKNLTTLIILSLFSFSFVNVYNYIISYKVGDDFTMVLKGTSNVHDWESSITSLSGTANLSFSEAGSMEITNCSVKIPVKSIKSSKGSIMDKKTWKALESDNHPNIEYRLGSFKQIKKSADGFTAETTGTLKIAGASKSINMTVNINESNNGFVTISGSKALKMTDFNIDPPTALLGTMKTGDDITIEFSIQLERE